MNECVQGDPSHDDDEIMEHEAPTTTMPSTTQPPASLLRSFFQRPVEALKKMFISGKAAARQDDAWAQRGMGEAVIVVFKREKDTEFPSHFMLRSVSIFSTTGKNKDPVVEPDNSILVSVESSALSALAENFNKPREVFYFGVKAARMDDKSLSGGFKRLLDASVCLLLKLRRGDVEHAVPRIAEDEEKLLNGIKAALAALTQWRLVVEEKPTTFLENVSKSGEVIKPKFLSRLLKDDWGFLERGSLEPAASSSGRALKLPKRLQQESPAASAAAGGASATGSKLSKLGLLNQIKWHLLSRVRMQKFHRRRAFRSRHIFVDVTGPARELSFVVVVLLSALVSFTEQRRFIARVRASRSRLVVKT